MVGLEKLVVAGLGACGYQLQLVPVLSLVPVLHLAHLAAQLRPHFPHLYLFVNLVAGLENLVAGLRNLVAGLENLVAGLENLVAGLENLVAGLQDLENH